MVGAANLQLLFHNLTLQESILSSSLLSLAMDEMQFQWGLVSRDVNHAESDIDTYQDVRFLSL